MDLNISPINQEEVAKRLLQEQDHMFKLMSLMRVHLKARRVKCIGGGEYLFWDKNICWSILQHENAYLLSKINCNEEYDIVFCDDQNVFISPEEIAEKIARMMGYVICIPRKNVQEAAYSD